jgi:glucan phosphoethanolaminetransferase (alkaline phosphatase superfamily)
VNPLLDSMPSLIDFSNIYSLAPNTELSWPFFLTLKKAGDSERYPTTKSFISAFKEAGYKTYFVSFYIDQNYSKGDSFAWIAFEADKIIKGLPAGGGRMDDVTMLPAIRRILAEKGPKLVVISTQGSHPGFENTCPLDYDVFQPSVLTQSFSPAGFVNGYDDTVRMTDDFLASIIATLQHSRSVMFYLSDHGTGVCDNGGQAHTHAFFKAEYRPACVAWASDSFLDGTNNAALFEQGKKHAGAPVTSEYVFHSFLDLCGIQTEKLDHTKSLFSPDLMVPQEVMVEDFLGRWHKFSEVPDNPPD